MFGGLAQCCQAAGVVKLHFIHDVLISLALGTWTLIDCDVVPEQCDALELPTLAFAMRAQRFLELLFLRVKNDGTKKSQALCSLVIQN